MNLSVLCLFLVVSLVGLWSVIVAFPSHTHILLGIPIFMFPFLCLLFRINAEEDELAPFIRQLHFHEDDTPDLLIDLTQFKANRQVCDVNVLQCNSERFKTLRLLFSRQETP